MMIGTLPRSEIMIILLSINTDTQTVLTE